MSVTDLLWEDPITVLLLQSAWLGAWFYTPGSRTEKIWIQRLRDVAQYIVHAVYPRPSEQVADDARCWVVMGWEEFGLH